MKFEGRSQGEFQLTLFKQGERVETNSVELWDVYYTIPHDHAVMLDKLIAQGIDAIYMQSTQLPSVRLMVEITPEEPTGDSGFDYNHTMLNVIRINEELHRRIVKWDSA